MWNVLFKISEISPARLFFEVFQKSSFWKGYRQWSFYPSRSRKSQARIERTRLFNSFNSKEEKERKKAREKRGTSGWKDHKEGKKEGEKIGHSRGSRAKRDKKRSVSGARWRKTGTRETKRRNFSTTTGECTHAPRCSLRDFPRDHDSILCDAANTLELLRWKKREKTKEMFEVKYFENFPILSVERCSSLLEKLIGKKYTDCLWDKCKFVLIRSEMQKME